MSEPEFCAALGEVKEAYLRAWQQTKPDQTQLRETAYFSFKAISDVEGLLKRKAMSAKARDTKEELERGRNGTDANA